MKNLLIALTALTFASCSFSCECVDPREATNADITSEPVLFYDPDDETFDANEIDYDEMEE